MDNDEVMGLLDDYMEEADLNGYAKDVGNE